MQQEDLEPDAAACKLVLEVCERAGHRELALGLVGAMEGQLPEPGTATPAADEQATPSVASDAAKYSKGALLQRLRAKRADASRLAGAVAALREAGHLDAPEGYLQALRNCEHGQQWEWSLSLLDEAHQRGFELDAMIYNTALGACAKALRWEKALELLQAMHQRGVELDVATYHVATSACSKSGEWEPALVLLEHAQQLGVADPETYNIGMMACASCQEWPAALSLLDAAGESTAIPGLSRDLLTYGIAIYGCMQGGVWAGCLSLLEDMRSNEVEPDVVAYACVSDACKAAKKWEAAASILQEMRANNLNERVSDVLGDTAWVLDGPEMQQPVPLSALATMASKEATLYKYVHKRATPGDIDSVIEAIESFGRSRSWLKIQGDEKRELLEKSLRPGDRIVEFGCYVGYSSLVMARQLRLLGGGGSVTTCEVDAAVAYIARGIITLAGAEGEVQVRVGCASDWVATGQLGEVDFLLLDHRGTIYHEDLHAAEKILAPQARVFADNVLYPGAPLFLNYINVQGYKIKIHELKEFQRPDLDDWVVICTPPEGELGPMPRSTPPELRRLSAEVDAISWRSQQGPVNWVEFQERLKPIFYAWKEERGL